MGVIIPHVLGQLAAYLDGRLSSSEKKYVETHMKECESCTAHCESLRQLRRRGHEGLTIHGGFQAGSWGTLAKLAIFGIGVWLVFKAVQKFRSAPPPPSPTVSPAAVPKKAPPPASKPATSEAVLHQWVETATAAVVTPSTPAGAARIMPPLGPAEWKGIDSAIVEFHPITIQSQGAWEAAWREHHQNRSPIPTLPVIDFTRYMVIGIYAGAKPSAGYTIQITQIQTLEDKVLAVYQETSPSTENPVADVTTSPFHLRIIPRTDLPIRFEKR